MALWRRPLPPALAGTLAILALLPRVSGRLTAVLAAMTLVVAALPIATVVVTGLLVGTVPGVIAQGLDAPVGQYAIDLFLIACALILVGRVLAPFQYALATTFA